MAYRLATRSETFTIADNGDISRPKIGLGASGKWKLRGFVRRNSFGHPVERVPFTPEALAALIARDDWHCKNGRGRWHPCDLDHGTYREWGETVSSLYVQAAP